MTGQFRETLVFVAGATPQIITETICALALQQPSVHAADIFIITTATGRRIISDALITRGKLAELLAEYNLPPLHIGDDSFLVISDSNGEELDDIRSLEANEAAGDQIVDLVRRLAADPGSRLHCSLAGGRKTMSFYLGAALQLFGRKWDRLYHVLVTPAFETHPEFFYKPRQSRLIEATAPNGVKRILDTADAQIDLAELPFIRLRDKLTLQGAGFKDFVHKGQADIDTASVLPDLVVHFTARSLRVGVIEIELIPIQLTLYSVFLRRKLQHCHYPDRDYCVDCTGCYVPIGELASRPALEEMARVYGAIHGSRDKGEELLERWGSGFDLETLRQNISKINRAIRESLPDEAVAAFYRIKTSGRRWGGSRYGIRLDRRKIRFAKEDR